MRSLIQAMILATFAAASPTDNPIELHNRGLPLVTKQTKEIPREWTMIQCFWEPARCNSAIDPKMHVVPEHVTLRKLHKEEPLLMSYRFEGMQVDLFRQDEFDAWFAREMASAPEKIHLWKRHFDKWADRKVSRVLQEAVAEETQTGISVDIDPAQLEELQSEIEQLIAGGQSEIESAVNEYVQSDEFAQLNEDLNELVTGLYDWMGQTSQQISDSVIIETSSDATNSTSTTGEIALKTEMDAQQEEERDSTVHTTLACAAIGLTAISWATYLTCKQQKSHRSVEIQEPLL